MTKSIEQFLMKIQSVIGTKVIMNDANEIEEVHIVSDLRRSPKQILRDVEAILISEFDQNVDYKKVSIAQIKGDSVKTELDPRIRLRSIEYGNSGSSIDVTVTLEKFTELYSSTISGIKTTGNMKRIAGTATLQAVEKYLDMPELFVFEGSQEITLAQMKNIIVAITSIYRNREETYIGTARIGSDLNEAVCRATLDAINRHILQLECN